MLSSFGENLNIDLFSNTFKQRINTLSDYCIKSGIKQKQEEMLPLCGFKNPEEKPY